MSLPYPAAAASDGSVGVGVLLTIAKARARCRWVPYVSGMSRPKVSRVTASGSGPPRLPVSSASIAASSSSVSSKSKTSRFSAMRVGLVDFGIA